MINNIYKENYNFAHIIIDSKMNIVAANNIFKNEFGEKTNILELDKDFDLKKSRQIFCVKDKQYDTYTTLFENTNNMYDIFFIEKHSENNEKIFVSLIFIDNYQEVLDDIEDIKQPLLFALIDRKINSMAFELDGIVRKFEKDKYIFLCTCDKLEYLKENKFDILNQIREIDMGNKIPVTLSIGIGINGKNLTQCMEYSRAAIDLALSRGGDQVLIKDREKYSFFGGKTKEVENNTRVRARVKAYALTELIEESENVIIMGHKHADLDCIGSSIGIYRIAETLNKKCNIVLNEITSSISLFYERLIKEKKYQESVFISSKQAINETGDKTLLIVADTHRPNLCECQKLLDITKKIVVFDHHRKCPDAINNAVLTYHEPYASSTSELVTEMLLYVNHEIALSNTEADGLLAGIMVDTKNFTFKTGIKTFEAAAYLKRKSADTIRVKTLFKSSMEQFIAKTDIIEATQFYKENTAISSCFKAVENPARLAAQASDDMLNINEIDASIVLCTDGETIFVSARSLGGINVQIIMEKLGGGGHQTVSGAQIKNMSMKNAIDFLKEKIDEYLKEVKK